MLIDYRINVVVVIWRYFVSAVVCYLPEQKICQQTAAIKWSMLLLWLKRSKIIWSNSTDLFEEKKQLSSTNVIYEMSFYFGDDSATAWLLTIVW